MSKQMKILSGIAGVLVLVAVVLSMLGRLDLPIGPLNGMLAGEEEIAADGGDFPPANDTFVDPCADPNALPGTGDSTFDPNADPSAIDPSADPNADPAAVDPNADPGAVDPNAVDPAADPNAAAPVAAGTGAPARVLVADVTAEDPAALGDPAAGVDPAAAADPNADPLAADPAAVDPNAVDPAAGGVDPCADTGDGTGTGAGTGTDPQDPAAGGTGTGGQNGAADPKAKPATSDGTNNGNSPEALAAAKDATEVMQNAGIEVSTTASLVPTASGVGKKGAALRRYRGQVTGATLVIQLSDAALPQWSEAGKGVQRNLVSSFLTRLDKRYAKAARSVTVLDATGNVLAIGDAAANAKGSVKLY